MKKIISIIAIFSILLTSAIFVSAAESFSVEAINVSTGIIRVQFTEQINTQNENTKISLECNGEEVPASLKYDNDNTDLLIIPDSSLSLDESYVLRVSDIESVNSEVIGYVKEFSFEVLYEDDFESYKSAMDFDASYNYSNGSVFFEDISDYSSSVNGACAEVYKEADGNTMLSLKQTEDLIFEKWVDYPGRQQWKDYSLEVDLKKAESAPWNMSVYYMLQRGAAHLSERGGYCLIFYTNRCVGDGLFNYGNVATAYNQPSSSEITLSFSQYQKTDGTNNVVAFCNDYVLLDRSIKSSCREELGEFGFFNGSSENPLYIDNIKAYRPVFSNFASAYPKSTVYSNGELSGEIIISSHTGEALVNPTIVVCGYTAENEMCAVSTFEVGSEINDTLSASYSMSCSFEPASVKVYLMSENISFGFLSDYTESRAITTE